MDLTGSRLETFAGSYNTSNKFSGFIKGSGFPD
jgi:hypothetical protein